MEQLTGQVVITETPARRWPRKAGTFSERWDLPEDAVRNAPTLESAEIDGEIVMNAECPRCHCTGARYMPFMGLTQWDTVAWYRVFSVCRVCGLEQEL